MSDDTVFMMVSRHSNTKTYHLKRDCRSLKSSVSRKKTACGFADDQPPVRPITKKQADRRGLELCRFCDPTIDNYENTNYRTEAYQALKRAAKGDD